MSVNRFFHSFIKFQKQSFIFYFQVYEKPYEIKIEWDGRASSILKARDNFCGWFISNWTIPWKNNKLYFNITDEDK